MKAAEDCFRLFDLGRNERSGMVFVLVCYLDDSDNDQGPVMGVAGYVSFVDKWVDFERAVEPFLQSFGVDVIRGKDFHHGKGCYKGWDGHQKRDFVDGLYGIAGECVIGGVNSVVQKSWLAENRKTRPAQKFLSPLGTAFGNCLASLMYKDAVSLMPNDIRLSVLVEFGNSNNGNILKYWNWIKQNWEPLPRPLGSLQFVDKHSCRAIQLADFPAFHGRREGEKWDREGHPEIENEGYALETMIKYIPHRHNRYFKNESATGLSADRSNALFVPLDGKL